MRKWCLFIALCLLFSSARAQAGVEEQLDLIFSRYSTLGACVAIFENGRVTYTHTYGVLRPGGPEVTEDTAFQVGSISKMVGCIGLMQLMDEQGISLDAELGDVLGYPVRNPAYPAIPVTLRQLMTHTASLRDSGDYDDALRGDGLPLRDLFHDRSAYTFFSKTQPGTRRVYSNFGGGLIGSLIEALSGMTLDDYLDQTVFAPRGVTAAYQASRMPEDVPLADMYLMPQRRLSKRLRDDLTDVREPDPEHNYYFTAGKLIISAPDLCKILIALCDGGVCGNARILQEGWVREMLTAQNYLGSVSCESGNGLFLNITQDEVDGRLLYGHGGKANGMLCAAYFDPTDRTGVVMLTNGCQNRSAYNGVGMLGRQILSLCYEQLIDPTHEAEDPFEVRPEV